MRFLLLSFLILFCSEAKAQQSDNLEEFESFIINFKKDSTFQKSRLINPVTIIYSTGELVEVEDGLYEFALDTVEVPSEDWKYESLSHRENVKSSIISKSSEQIQYRIQGLDNGILFIYTFVSKNGKWFLKQYKNDST
ncbi:MAG: hypothetical protein JXR20_12380 [Balneola sp.]